MVKYLDENRIEYDTVWAILDFYEQQGKAELFSDGSFKVDTTLWNKAKAEYCATEDIRFILTIQAFTGVFHNAVLQIRHRRRRLRMERH